MKKLRTRASELMTRDWTKTAAPRRSREQLKTEQGVLLDDSI